MRRIERPTAVLSTVLACCATSCTDQTYYGTDWVWAEEEAAREAYFATPIRIEGYVREHDGGPVAGAIVALGDASTTTSSDGRFALEDLERHNGLLTVDAAGFHREVVPLQLMLPRSQMSVGVETISLTRERSDVVRFVFTGDVSLGRRFLKSDGDPPTDRLPDHDPDALISAANPLEGSLSVVQFMTPLVRAADYSVINLETVVTDTPKTPYRDKPYIFFTLPRSLPALAAMGVDYVGLGNNHINDYFDQGIIDTHYHLDKAGLAHSGAGLTVDEAFEPHRETIKGHDYSFLSMTSINGSQYSTLFIATDEHGGAANLRDTERVALTIESERAAGNIPIVNMHTGFEYTYSPSEYVLDRTRLAVKHGAGLVVAHHPHVAQGFAYEDGVLVAHSLGNFIFDQDRIDTMMGAVLRVDMRGDEVVRAQTVPVYLSDYRPRHVTGRLADLLLRRLGKHSVPWNAVVIPALGFGDIVPADDDDYVRDERVEDVTVTIGESGSEILDLRGRAATDESIAEIAVQGPEVAVQIGHDILVHGDFETMDIGPERLDPKRWYTTASSFPCMHAPHRGVVALCSLARRSETPYESIAVLRNRIRVDGDSLHMPNKDVSVIGYVSGENAGPATLTVRYYASIQEREFGSEVALETVGSFPWRRFTRDLAIPPDDPAAKNRFADNPRALRLFLSHSPPAQGEGVLRVDDIAVISWDSMQQLNASTPVASVVTPNPAEFVRVRGRAGSYTVSVRLVRLRRKAS